MAVTPINITRVSNNLQTLSLLNSLRKNTLGLFLEQNRIATGNKFNAPSENPVAANQAVQLTEVLEQQDQILSNIRHADSFLSATDTAISGVSDLLIQARSIASEMVNSTTDQAMRNSDAELVLGIINELVRTGNRQYGNTYLFGGQQTTREPFRQDVGGVYYQGDTNGLFTRVDAQHEAQFNLNGADLFGAVSSQVSGNVDLNPIVTRDVRLADVAGAAGKGVQRGMFRVSLSSPATSFAVDLSRADDLGDVVDAINNAAAAAGLTVGAAGQFNATLSSNGVNLNVAGGTVTAAEIGTGVTARDLGLLGTGAGTLAGTDLNPLLTPTTPIASLLGGASPVLGSIQITSGARSATVDLSSAQTVQDILNAINGSDLQVEARINADGTGIDVVNRMSGSAMTIGENGGNTAALLGIRSLYSDTPLSSLNNGQGITTIAGKPDLRITAKNGSTVDVSVDGAQTIQDVLDKINAAATAAGVNVSASLKPVGNGIQIVDNTGGGGVLSIDKLNLSPAIDGLGLNTKVANSTDTVLSGNDTNGIRPNSVFTALQDLYSALKRGDTAGITDAGGRIGDFVQHVTQMQGMVGARSQVMSSRLQLTEDAVVATKKLLSEVKDLDYSEAVTKFQLAQTTLQANLMTGSRLLQMSLMDFLGTA